MAKRGRERINRIVALIAGAVLAFGLVPAPALAAGGPDGAAGGSTPEALRLVAAGSDGGASELKTASDQEPVTYLDENGVQQTCTAYSVLNQQQAHGYIDMSPNESDNGWIVVEEDVTVGGSGYISLGGDIKLILCDGVTLEVPEYIQVSTEYNASLTVYAQSTGDDMGCIMVLGKNTDSTLAPSIGDKYSPGPITVNGGHLRLISRYAAGIGAGGVKTPAEANDGGKVTINGGIVEINGWNDNHEICSAAGIGGGQGGDAGDIVINGGTVRYATPASDDVLQQGSAIGCGFGGKGGSVTINGGTVEVGWPKRTIPMPAIGGLENCEVTINGGNVDVAGPIGNSDSGTTISLSWTGLSDSLRAEGYFGNVTLQKAFTDASTGAVFPAGVNAGVPGGRTLTPFAGTPYSVTCKDGSSVLSTTYQAPRSKVIRPADPTSSESHRFVGWYSDEGCTSPWNFETVPAGDVTLYAGWAQTVSFASGAVSKTYGDAPFTNAATSSGDGTIAYSCDNAAVASVDETTGQVTIVGAGSATVTATVAETVDCQAGSASYALTVSPKQGAFTVTLSPTSFTYDGSPKEPAVTVMDGTTAIPSVEYKVEYADNTNAGRATVKVSDAKPIGGNYKIDTTWKTFWIDRAPISPSVAIAGWAQGAYDAVANAPAVTGNPGNGAVTFEYKPAADSDEAYSEDVPTDVGAYTVRASVAQTKNYDAGSATANFSITGPAAEVTAAPTANALTYTGRAQELVSAGTASGGAMAYSLDAGGPFATSVPSETDAGTYHVYYKAAGDAGHEDSAVAGPVEVTIARAPISPSVAIAGWAQGAYDAVANAPVVTGNPGNGAVTFEYKAAGDPDEAYSGAVPTAVGDYTVRASIAQTRNYEAGFATTDFSIEEGSVTPGPATKFAVAFDANGGSGSMGKLSVPAGSKATLPANAFTRAGYSFASWNTAKDGSGTAYADRAEVAPTQDTTLYAQWRKEPTNAEKAAERVLAAKDDNDLAGSAFAPTRLASKKQTKGSIKLSWAKVRGARAYSVYGNKCGKGNRYVKLATVDASKASFTVKEVVDARGGKAKLRKGTMYKFLIVADMGAAPAEVSKTIHVATAGKKGTSNYTKVTVGKKVLSKAKKIKVGKTLKLKAKAVKKKGAKVKAHVKLRYESSNASVAVVSKSGKVKARGKGTCFVYAFAQNGVCKKVKVKVR